MRLHLLTNLFPPDVLGGYELLAADVATRLRARGHTVRVVTTGADRHEAGVARVLRLSRPFGQAPSRDRARHFVAAIANRRALGREMARHGVPDATLVMSLRRLGLEPLRVYREAGVPTVVTVNDDWPASFVPPAAAWSSPKGLLDRGPLARHTWRGARADRVVYLSETIRKIVRASGAPLPEGIVQAQGIDLAAFPERAARLIGAAPELLFVGRLHPTKAPDVAIDALIALRARGVDARLTFAGTAADPAYDAELRARAEPVAAWVTWLGLVPRARLCEVYARADVFLYPLRWEGEAQGLTYMEAMAIGVPVVAFPRGGAKELLDPHDVVANAATCDGEGFATAIVALASDPRPPTPAHRARAGDAPRTCLARPLRRCPRGRASLGIGSAIRS